MSSNELDAATQARYEKERNKRLRADGSAQFIALHESKELSHLNDDIWADHAALNASEPAITDGGKYEVVILGAGYGGLIFAARLIQAGVAAEDIRLIDVAGGFGGTWYWNRYPGLMCDVESYMYMPLLEETGYMPKHKYAYGPELLEHAKRIAQHFGLSDKALFRSQATEVRWDDEVRSWKIQIIEGRGPNEARRQLNVSSRFMIVTGGVLNVPHVPKIPGLDSTEIPSFHSARWRYDLTGGTPEVQQLEKLREKRVGIIGTGATAVQIIPELAKWSKQLVVFQRTPSSCDARGQRATDPEEWKQIADGKGWQRRRIENFNHFLRAEPLEVNLVKDGWCEMPNFSAGAGSTRKVKIQPDGVEAHVKDLNIMDLPRAQRLRARVDSIVHDKDTAEKLKSWYPTFCKRPTFHDEHLPAFNQPNVQLVETAGFGVDEVTSHSVRVHDVEYELDLLVFSTGFRTAPTRKTHTPARNCDVEIIGRSGLNMNQKWDAQGPLTLHGCCTHDFPNLFFTGLTQSGAACEYSSSILYQTLILEGNFSYMLNNHAEHVAFLIQSARSLTQSNRCTVEPSVKAEEQWADETASLSNWFASWGTCTPGYWNNYGTPITRVDEMKRAARSAPWGFGSQDYVERLEKWRASGGLQDLVVCS
ncbi:hypothetical protein HBH98_008350 [Parastagonospora nodorum]|nr:hypothetical protein HBH47_006440 [Parastagonospora nodorum]KAH4214327.1 hypothetical protein HBI95_006510 [Parastagonospora nodorum]KAH4353645.1 hypothetical protein HBH98_008350 [Parastagonospora nodorum]KAH4397656.1 hypothetical protein HBH97_006600 [Parastagonospora nodorum]KAH4430099.1 hypothetical protein HBH99_008410 [Parastagonospora nodorum]